MRENAEQQFRAGKEEEAKLKQEQDVDAYNYSIAETFIFDVPSLAKNTIREHQGLSRGRKINRYNLGLLEPEKNQFYFYYSTNDFIHWWRAIKDVNNIKTNAQDRKINDLQKRI